MAMRSDIRMLALSRRLDETLTAFDDAGIPVLLLKGAALGRTVYGSIPRRPMLDIDLLVPAERVSEARQISLSLGWVASELEKFETFYRGHFHLPPLLDGSGMGFNLELHTGLLLDSHQFALPLEEFWSRSRELPGFRARVPATEDLLLHVALHFSWSHTARVGAWRTFRDLRTLAEAGTVDWTGFVRLAKSSGGAAAAHWTLRLARSCGITEVPGTVEPELRPSLPGPVLSLLERHLASQWYALDAPCPSNRLDQGMWKLAMLEPDRRASAVLPWDRDPTFQQPHVTPVRETLSDKLLRHLTRLGGYARYVHRVVLGRTP
jgi:hypothetical protein